MPGSFIIHAWTFKSLYERSPNHKTDPTFTDTYYRVSVFELACESLHRPSIEIETRMRAAADMGRFFSAVLSKIHVKTRQRGGAWRVVRCLFIMVFGYKSQAVGLSYFV